MSNVCCYGSLRRIRLETEVGIVRWMNLTVCRAISLELRNLLLTVHHCSCRSLPGPSETDVIAYHLVYYDAFSLHLVSI